MHGAADETAVFDPTGTAELLDSFRERAEKQVWGRDHPTRRQPKYRVHSTAQTEDA